VKITSAEDGVGANSECNKKHLEAEEMSGNNDEVESTLLCDPNSMFI